MTSQLDLTAVENQAISLGDIARASKKLSKIFESKPDWVRIKSVGTYGVRFSTEVVRGGGEPCFPLECIAFENGSDHAVAVKEADGEYLPSFCPERHINFDGTFCVGLRAGRFELEPVAIEAWWNKLKNFIVLQQTANGTRKWNPKAAMRHGDAGDLQILGEQVSEQLGLRDAFDCALQWNRGELHEAKFLVSKDSGLLINGRMECPCGRKNKSGRPFLRRECRKKGFDCLAQILARIDTAEQRFWESHKEKVCCGTMDSCPLRNAGNQHSSAMA